MQYSYSVQDWEKLGHHCFQSFLYEEQDHIILLVMDLHLNQVTLLLFCLSHSFEKKMTIQFHLPLHYLLAHPSFYDDATLVPLTILFFYS